MITSLFIRFDPIIASISPLILIILPLSLVFASRVLISLVVKIKQSLAQEVKVAANIKRSFIISGLISLFIFIVLINVCGLLPFIFTRSAHLGMTLSFGLCFWLVTVLVGFYSNWENFVAHLVPNGCPLALAQFIVLIESVRLIIRPITLSVRLAANMTAGHLLLILCSTPVIVFNWMRFSLLILLILESAVALIQAYVFVILISMYIGENN